MTPDRGLHLSRPETRACTPPHVSDLRFYSRLGRPRRANFVHYLALVAITEVMWHLAKAASVFSTEVVNGRGKLAKITAHRCAPALGPVVAITGTVLTLLSKYKCRFVLCAQAAGSFCALTVRQERVRPRITLPTRLEWLRRTLCTDSTGC